jgi:hypothetical protein
MGGMNMSDGDSEPSEQAGELRLEVVRVTPY